MAAPKPPIDWTTPYLDSFREIEHVIRLSKGFVLLPVEAAGPDLGRALGEWLTAQGYPAVIHEPRNDKAWEEIAGTLYETEVAPNGVVMVLGGQVLPKGFYEGVWLLNQKRDPIVKKLGRPLLWCGPREFLSLTWERAPDFWSIRAVERRLEPAPGASLERAPASPRVSGPSYDVNLDGEVVMLRKLLAKSARYGLGAALRLARRLARADELAEAEEVLEKATTTQSPGRGDERNVIAVWLLRATIARRQGRLASAREYLRQAESVAGPPPPDLLAQLLLEQASFAVDEGNLEEARREIEDAMEVSRLDRRSVVEDGLVLANLYLATPGPENAQRALEILDQAEARRVHFASEGGQGADADRTVDILTTKARALAATGSATEAESALRYMAGRIPRIHLLAGHAAALLVRIARTAIDIGARDLAKDLATRALAMAREAGDVYAERHAAETLDRARPLTA